MQEILKQPQYEPMSLENQVMVLFAGTNGFADGSRWKRCAMGDCMLRYMESSYPEIGKDIADEEADHTRNDREIARRLTNLQFLLAAA